MRTRRDISRSSFGKISIGLPGERERQREVEKIETIRRGLKSVTPKEFETRDQVTESFLCFNKLKGEVRETGSLTKVLLSITLADQTKRREFLRSGYD